MGFQLAYQNRAVLFADVVEAGRLVEQDESAAVRKWLQFEDDIKADILPKHEGRYIKGLGDGLMVEFPDARHAASAALEIHHWSKDKTSKQNNAAGLPLRISIETGELITSGGDIYGQGVNIAARLLSLAGPGETVVSARVRDQLVDGVDGEIIDLGECFLRHISKPVRAYRLGVAGEQANPVLSVEQAEFRPTIAVLPFSPLLAPDEHRMLGDILAEELISFLSRSAEFNVISRLSSSALAARAMDLEEVAAKLGADYVVSGGFRSDGRKLIIDLELSDAASARVAWAESINASIEDMFSDDPDVIRSVAEKISSTIVKQELRRARRQPAATLQNYSLLLSAITLMHRLSPDEHREARVMLEALIERGGRQAITHAWLANWYVLTVIQGWSKNRDEDVFLAQQHSARALQADPESSRALTIDGFVQTHLTRQLDLAADRYLKAIKCNPNNSLAWLLKGTLHAFRDEGVAAMRDTQHAMRLSPLDPLRFIYEAHSAGACLAAGQFEQARQLAEESRRANRCHTSTLRILATALWELGCHDEAREVVTDLRALDPGLTAGSYLKQSPSADYKTGQLVAHVLKQAGLPA